MPYRIISWGMDPKVVITTLLWLLLAVAMRLRTDDKLPQEMVQAAARTADLVWDILVVPIVTMYRTINARLNELG